MVVYQVYPKKKKNVFGNLSVTWILIIVNVLLFMIFTLLDSLKILPLEYIAISNIGVFEHFYFWTLFTSMFMHGGIFHLFVNMFSLMFVGNLLEKLLGKKRYLYFYLIAGFFAGLLHISFESSFAVGASGALFGLIGVLVFLTPNLPVYMMFIPIPIKMKYAAPGMLVALWLISLGAGIPIGNLAHLGGLLAGVTYGIYLRKRFPNKTKIISQRFGG